MQKKLIAAAIAAVASTGAFAQVTMYGIVDMYGATGTTTSAANVDTKFLGVNAGGLSGSRLGFKAEEDLGDGMAAVADVTMGSLTLDAATNNIGSTRQSYLGLKTKSGTVVAGRLQTSGFDYMGGDTLGAGAFDPLTALSAATITVAGNARAATAINAGSRVTNAVGYMNTFGPVSIKIAHARAAETPAGGLRATVNNLGVVFNQGPLKAELVYINQADVSAAGGISDLALAGYYDLGVARLALNFVQTSDTARQVTAGSDYKTTRMQLGASIPMGKGKVNVAMATAKTDLSGDKKGSGFGIDYEHALGKRTTAYVGYMSGKSGNHGSTSFTGVAGAAGAEKNASTLGVGGRLTF